MEVYTRPDALFAQVLVLYKKGHSISTDKLGREHLQPWIWRLLSRVYLKNNNELCIRRFKAMSTNRDKKNKKNDELTAQERQSIYNNSYFFKKEK